MEAPKELYIEKKGTDIRQYWWENPLLHKGHDGYEYIKYIRSDLAELTINDIAFIANTVWNMRVHNDGVSDNAIYEAALSQFNEERYKSNV